MGAGDTVRNRFKQRLLAGDTLIGFWSCLCSPLAAEAVSHSAFDWMLFDTEHSPLEVSGVLPLLQASAAGRLEALVRPAWNDAVLIKRFLDVGAQTLLIPFVQNVAEARAAVAAAKYPPVGIRGIAGTTRASGYGRNKEYLRSANDETCVLVQVETRDAIGRLAEIAAVDGVDGVFIGPSDLAASMGHIGDPDHPEVQEAMEKAAETIAKAGKPAGALAVNLDQARRFLDVGYRFVAVGVDLSLLVKSTDELAEKAMVLARKGGRCAPPCEKAGSGQQFT